MLQQLIQDMDLISIHQAAKNLYDKNNSDKDIDDDKSVIESFFLKPKAWGTVQNKILLWKRVQNGIRQIYDFL